MLILLHALGSALSTSLNATTKKSVYMAPDVGIVTLILVLVVVPPLFVVLLPGSA